MKPTGYFFHPQFALHEMGPYHPECPARLPAIERALKATGLWERLDHREATAAAWGDLELAHSRLHLAALRGLGDTCRDEAAAGGPTHMQVDPDTSMNEHTWEAAVLAAGAAIDATDAVMAGEMNAAFCAVRPPGHHACRDKAMGFCFINNVAVAAKHALDRHHLQRVAIVDFDVHHGNGTEDIVAGDDRILMCSFFQHPFYPEGGARSQAFNLVNVPVPARTRGMDIRDIVDLMWMPRLEAHRPELVFISAGFDAHRDDDLGQLMLNEEDFAWITARLCDVARRFAKGRVVSCLEGGYHLGALGRSVQAHVAELARL